MTDVNGFWKTAANKLRPKALAAVIDLGTTLILWGIVLGAEVARKIMGAVGVDPDFVQYVGTAEKWTFFASFIELFVHMLVHMVRRVYAHVKDEEYEES